MVAAKALAHMGPLHFLVHQLASSTKCMLESNETLQTCCTYGWTTQCACPTTSYNCMACVIHRFMTHMHGAHPTVISFLASSASSYARCTCSPYPCSPLPSSIAVRVISSSSHAVSWNRRL